MTTKDKTILRSLAMKLEPGHNDTALFVRSLLNRTDHPNLSQLKEDRLRVEGLQNQIDQAEKALLKIANKYLANGETNQEIKL